MNFNLVEMYNGLLIGGGASYGSTAGSGRFDSDWVRSTSNALIGFFTTVKLD